MNKANNVEKENAIGRFGKFGGQYVAETLMPALEELDRAFDFYIKDLSFQAELRELSRDYVGRPSPLYFARNLTEYYGKAKIFLKREDLNHTGSHKINNSLGQCLLAKRMGKKKIIAETGAGQHGVATATACALLGLECTVFMGEEDMKRQEPNVFRMNMLGTKVEPVRTGQATLKEAVSQAIREWISTVDDTHYVLGTASGPHPFPKIVKALQSVIGKEAKAQSFEKFNKLPDYVLACVGGGSNSIGIFSAFIDEPSVKLIGLEAGGTGDKHAATLTKGKPGVLHGTLSYVLQDEYGMILDAHSVSAGLDYPGVGPEHSHLLESGRANYYAITDQEALNACRLLCRKEGIIPALESSHALAYLEKLMPNTKADENVVVCLSGRGDKDVSIHRCES